MNESDKVNDLTEKDIKGLNGFIDFLDMLSNSDGLQKYKTTTQYTATEISQLTRESYYQGRAEESEKYTKIVNYLETAIDYMIEEIHSMINLGEWIDKKLDNLDTKQEIKQYFRELVDEHSGTSKTNNK